MSTTLGSIVDALGPPVCSGHTARAPEVGVRATTAMVSQSTRIHTRHKNTSRPNLEKLRHMLPECSLWSCSGVVMQNTLYFHENAGLLPKQICSRLMVLDFLCLFSLRFIYLRE